MEKLDFPINAQNKLLLTLDVLLQNNDFENIINCYETNNFEQCVEDIKNLAQKQNVCAYSAYMLFIICLLPQLFQKYLLKGISEQCFYDTMSDLRYKLEECALVYGEVGTFVPRWYKGFFEMRIFTLGRLQFEINNTWFDCTINGKFIPKGTKVLSVHIPRTGTKLEHSLVLDSYKQAVDFFKEEFDENIIFICNSWLLYPWNREILSNDSNLAKFYDDFTIVSSGEYKDYGEVWRLFDCLYDGNPEKLPNDSSLRRAYIERIKSCKPIGHGTGVIVYKKTR